ncbi:4-phosphopantetheinyl transferase family protein [Aquimarina sp. AD10]|uniref:4'-phosphopantetheinyl transferase superfamily protein n=1 Tax=Aquimarina sp. AD10 TaxID=1714849 RepID=UPI000E5359CC|nr:4'-phosphopantetheinyl transferase superfamily protein [Aquimarina sp. AD10]AXT59510.1 4-phosphopantetheinyl transferase family protein [Aquimarina sp. AD10]RKN00411.1 4'-phosphopantetheinyl transferase superfamily protein [Aquimarina sp. AD10]
MIGNDIVDLELAKKQSNWQRKGWLQKIFTETEQQLILDSCKPELQVWKFWSMKEACYKAHQRCLAHSPRYNPLSFECALNGLISIQGEQYQSIVESTGQYVYSVAKKMPLPYTSKIFDTKVDLKVKLSEFVTMSSNNISSVHITKDQNNIPQLLVNAKTVKYTFSFTNHGKYAAFAITI